MNKKKLLLIAIKQYGYSNPYFHHAKYLKPFFDITYFCFDDSLPKQIDPDIHIEYIKRSKIKKLSIFNLIFGAINYLRKYEFDIIVISEMYFAFLLKIFFPHKKMSMDIQVGFAGNKKFKNFIFREKIKFNAMFFNNITVLSKQLSDDLKIKNSKILPLGAEVVSTSLKEFNLFNLLYIGTFNNRNLDQVITGFSKFYYELKDQGEISFTIAGFGTKEVESTIRNLIIEYQLENVINLVGKYDFEQRKILLDTHNVGVSYIPKTDYYDVQPATKTMEYLLAGMPVIATSTTKNKELVDLGNGVLIEDNLDAVYAGLKIIFSRLSQFNSSDIIERNKKFTWKNIVEAEYLPYLNDILGD